MKPYKQGPPGQNLLHIPALPLTLLTALENLYPEKCPHIEDTERAIWMYAGARDLVRKLRFVYEQQSKDTAKRFEL